MHQKLALIRRLHMLISRRGGQVYWLSESPTIIFRNPKDTKHGFSDIQAHWVPGVAPSGGTGTSRDILFSSIWRMLLPEGKAGVTWLDGVRLLMDGWFKGR